MEKFRECDNWLLRGKHIYLELILVVFRQFKELPEYDENQFKIYVFTPQKPVVTFAEFFHGAVKKMVSSIREWEQDSGDDLTTPANKIKFNNFTDGSLNRVLKMPPPSIEMGASGSGSVSGSKVNNFTDGSLNRVLKMPPPSIEMGASGSENVLKLVSTNNAETFQLDVVVFP
nr:hypothetical protein [Tanacetum cinerariifolium]